MNDNSENYYQILGISQNATASDIKNAYMTICKDLHPDVLPSSTGDHLKKLAEERLKQVNEAYSILKDHNLRVEYDQQLKKKYDDVRINNINYSKTEAKESTYEDLLCDAVINEGLNILIEEEKSIYSLYLIEMKNIQAEFKEYLSELKTHDSMNFYPDTIINRLDRVLRVFYGMLPIFFIAGLFFSFFITLGLFIVHQIILYFEIMDHSLSLGSWINILVYISLPIAFLCLIGVILDNDSFVRKKQKTKNDDDSYYFYSDDFLIYKHKYIAFGSSVRLCKFMLPIYKKEYVKKIRKNSKQIILKMDEITKHRREIITKFKGMNVNNLTTVYISQLSYSERFLFVKALEEKAKEEQKKKQNEQATANAAKVAGAVGLIALFIASGGNFGP
jgi:curved DNA-binding protein CbpA